MNTKLLFIALLLFSFAVFAQDAKIPKVVKNSFAKHYPKATDVKWGKEGATEFEAGFKENGKNISVVFDEKGNIREIETTIQISELPKSASLYVKKNYPGFKITEAAKILDVKGRVTFEAEITKDKVKKDLLFDSKGNPKNKDLNKKNDGEKEDKDME